MKHTIEIECGEKTCASEPGKLCRFVWSMKFGSYLVCAAFGAKLFDDQGDGLGWLLRCDECLKTAKEVKR